MADPEHVDILSKGASSWNKWRSLNPGLRPDLSKHSIPRGLMLKKEIPKKMRSYVAKHAATPPGIEKYKLKNGINFSRTNFNGARISGYLPSADFTGSDFWGADLSGSDLSYSIISECRFREANFERANLSNATIINSNFYNANFINTILLNATMKDCIVYGVSAWGIVTNELTIQKNLIIENECQIFGSNIIKTFLKNHKHLPLMVDDLGLAQFIYLIKETNLGKGLNELKVKGVLLLGKFKDGGKDILESLAKEIRKKQLLPIIFDFDSPKDNNLIETVTVLAGISKVVIANLNGSSVPAELTRIAANYKLPIITFSNKKEENNIFAMFSDLLSEDNVLYFRYSTQDELLLKLRKKFSEALQIIDQNQKTRKEKAQLKKLNG